MSEQIWAAVIQGAATVVGSVIQSVRRTDSRATYARPGGSEAAGFARAIELKNIGKKVEKRGRFPAPRITTVRFAYQQTTLKMFRVQIHITAQNVAKSPAVRGGITISFPGLPIEPHHQVKVRQSGSPAPYVVEPGSEIWGYRNDGSFGPMTTEHIIIENWQEPWAGGYDIFVDVELLISQPVLNTYVRSWANWNPEDGSKDITNDPASIIQSSLGTIDQQNFPAYAFELDMGREQLST